MRLFATNLVDSATITASSENDSLLAVNVANELRTKVWRTGATLTQEWIKFDCGAAQAVTSLILANHTLSTDTLVALEGNATDVWGTPSFTQASERGLSPSSSTGSPFFTCLATNSINPSP